MKKYIFAGIAAALLATSCANEEMLAPAGDGTVVFTAELPALGSRAYGDGTTASALTAYVYSAEEGQTPEYLFSKTADFAGATSTTIELNLVTGKTYDIVFWTQATGAPYEYSTTDRTITVTYGGKANDESRDAFFFTEKGLKIDGPVQKSVYLKRPFAQLNVLTSDYDEALASKVEVKQTSLTMSLPNVINLATGDVTGDDEVSYALADIPGDDIVKGEKTYKYLSMNYILAPADKAVVDVKIGTDFDKNSELAFTSVPVQRNYRTNIYGALLTNPAIFDVEILPDFGDINIDKDKEIAPGVEYDPETKTYKLYNKDALLWLNDQTNTASKNFNGETVILVADVDLAGVEWTPLAKGITFMGTFDGGNNTVSNLKTSDPDCAGFFWSARNVKNLTLKNVDVSGNYKAGAISGDGLCGHFDNCHVDGGTIVSTPRLVNGVYDDANNVGGITGYLSAESTASIKNCSVKNLTVNAYRKVGGIVGATNGPAVVTGNEVSNVKVIADMTNQEYDKAATRQPDAGEVVGVTVSANATVSNNTHTGVTVTVIRPTAEGNIEIGTPEALNALSEIIAAGETFEGKTIVLTSDIALDPSTPFEPLGKFERNGTQVPFSGTFDGQGHTISGLNIETTEYKKGAGLFGYVQNGTIKNLTLDHPTVKGTAYTGALVGLAYKGTGYSTVEGVTVDGATIVSVPAADASGVYDGGNNVGGLIGITQYGIVLKGCTVKNSSVTGYAKVGGMLGLACYQAGTSESTANTTVYENNKVENTTVTQSLVNAYEGVPTTIGAFAGLVPSSTLPSSNTATGVSISLELGTAGDLVEYAESLNNGSYLKGITVKLIADIDLAGRTWEPIGQTGKSQFSGIFDGQGHTISNFKVDALAYDENNTYSAGLFGWVEDHSGKTVIKGVTIDGADIKANHYAGALVGYTSGGVTIEDCHAKNINIISNNKVAALIGFMNGNDRIKACSVANSTISAGRDGGQMLGAGKAVCVANDCTATNVTVTANGSGDGSNINEALIGRVL